ncbi:MAG: sel1 repeat family protein [Candidatus Methanoplasma sp.]|jgi:TPR repeat protein|nr:sel1 repeat family protein [Candidatus Methanoplasma sp.]
MTNIFRSAENGDPYAMLGIAYMYHHGKGAEQDTNASMNWYVKSASAGCARAKWELAKIFRDGTIVESDAELHILYLIEASKAGVPEAMMELARHYLSGDMLPVNEKEAFALMLSAAEQNLPMAQFLTGYMTGRGIGTPRDVSDEEMWYSKVGMCGDAEMFYRIGMEFEYGLDVDVDLFEAGRWYKIGADMGHEKCFLSWGSVLNALSGGRKDTMQDRMFMLSHTESEKDKAARTQAFEVADQFLDLGEVDKAVQNYKKAAELGSSTAMFTLATMYHDGTLIKRNDREALDMLSKASHAGSEDAQFLMGSLFEEGGMGFKKDPAEAVKYFTQAVANGHLVALFRLEKYMKHPEVHVRRNATVKR